MTHWAKSAQTDHVTLRPWPLTLEVIASVWCRSSSSIHIRSLKIVGLAIGKIWRTMCVTINGPGMTFDLWPWRSMAPVADADCRPPSVHQVWNSYTLPFGRYGARCLWALMGLVTLTFDLLTLKLVRKSHQRWGTCLPNLGTLGLWILELFAMSATDGRTDGRTDKNNAYCPLPHGWGIIKQEHIA